MITEESVYCPDCEEIRPVTYSHQKEVKCLNNDHAATEILCDRHHVVATLHHPSVLAKFLGLTTEPKEAKQ